MSEHKRVDPRSVRSKKMLKQAVFAFLEEGMDINQLTVQKISKRAELNRATFYLHYEDINDLLRQIVREIFDELSMKMEPLLRVKGGGEPGQLAAFLTCMYEYRTIFAVFIEHQGFKSHLTGLLKHTIEQRREERGVDSSGDLASLDIVAASLLGILIWWIKDGSAHNAEYIADQIALMYKRRYL